MVKLHLNLFLLQQMEDNVLLAMPDKDIPVKVEGAHIGYSVKVGLRYTTGAHYETPVHACRSHEDPNDSLFPFHVPRLDVSQDKTSHPTVEIPVPYSAFDDGKFTFSIVFRCLNSCHKKFGKKQELILQLFDSL